MILGLTVLTLMVPAAVTFVPSFVMVSSLGWISTLRGLIIPVMFSAFATFLFRQFFLGFPRELEEAAAIDGAGYWRTFWSVVMPNALGICAAVGTHHLHRLLELVPVAAADRSGSRATGPSRWR